MPTVGSDNLSLAGFSGAVVDENGQTLLSTDTTGSKARIVGQSLQRELLDGIANGDFAIPPLNAESAIDADGNELPYWTWTGATGFTATIANETTYSANGNALLITVDTTAVAGTYATLSRYVPISNSGNRNYCYGTELFGFGETGTLANLGKQKVSLSCTAVDKDYTALTVTDTGFEVLGTGGASFTTGTGDKTPDARAAFLLITLKFELITSAVSATTSYRIGEVRLNRGQPQYALSDLSAPSESPWIISNDVGNFDVRKDDVKTWINLTNDSATPMYTMYLEATDGLGTGDIFIEAGSTLNLISGTSSIPAGEIILRAGTTVDVEAPNGVTITTDGTTLGTLSASVIDATTIRCDNTTTSDLLMTATGADFIMQDKNAADGTNPRILLRASDNTYYAGIKSGAVGVVQILSGSATTTYGQLWAQRIYPMNGTTASRYIFDNGTHTTTSSTFAVGTFGTTASAANVRASASTVGQLLFSSSSRRWKENIEDADDLTIAAAKKLKARHFNSKHEADNSKRLLGMIAEEVEEAGLGCAVEYDPEGLPLGLDWNAITAALLVRLEDAERRIAELESR